MTFVHGKGQVVTLDGDSLTAYGTSVTFTRTLDSHDTTTFGAGAHRYQGGLLDGTASIEGIYDATASTGVGAIIKPIQAAGTAVELVWEPQGAGTGNEKAAVDVIVTSFEQSAPVADMVTWTAELQFVEAVTDTVL